MVKFLFLTKMSNLRKEITMEHERKTGLVIKSVQYSTYTKTIVRIPTVYQLVTARQNSQSKKPTYFEKRNLQSKTLSKLRKKTFLNITVSLDLWSNMLYIVHIQKL